MNGRPYSEDELKTILHLYYNENKKAKQVAVIMGRSVKAIENVVKKHRDMIPEKDYKYIRPASEKSTQKEVNVVVSDPTPVYVTTHTEMSPREMIKHLYTLGYRIKNNELVVLVEQKVNIKDILING